MAYSMESVTYIYNDETGDKVYVGPDGDGLGLVEIRSSAYERVEARIAFTPEQAVLVAKAILDLYGPKS
jgi:hypothetical protein